MNRWDKDDKNRERKQERTEKMGRFMLVGSISFLAVYVFTIILESFNFKCITC